MPTWKYDLSQERPKDFATAIRPARVAVSYEGSGLPSATVNKAGVVKLELPDELITKIRTGTVLIAPLFQRHSASETDPQELFHIDILDL